MHQSAPPPRPAHCPASQNESGQVIGVRCQDRMSSDLFDVHAKVIINATGPFVDTLRQQSDTKQPPIITASSGAHITLPGYYGSLGVGLIVPRTKDGRVVFMLPWQDHIIAGTTDVKCSLSDRPSASEEEIAFILEAISSYLSIPVRRADVMSAWSGIRPLASDPHAKDTQNLVRDHGRLGGEGEPQIKVNPPNLRTHANRLQIARTPHITISNRSPVIQSPAK